MGWAGLGRLGLPCAMVLAQHHEVTGYDVSEQPWKILDSAVTGSREEGLAELIASGKHVTRAHTVAELVAASDVVFVAVQTPHAPAYGGEQPMPGKPRDFEYAYLIQACRDVARAALEQQKHVTLVVVSTVLPGTTDRLIRPLLNSCTDLVYSPQFIAMGTAVADFTDPEFVICGVEGKLPADRMRAAFLPVHGDDRLFCCDIVTAESVKVLYNTFISMKIVWANHAMEMCHKTGADCDTVVDALSKATDRVISPAYMRGGMGDGGACHPRDLIALSWLEERLGMAAGVFGQLVRAREAQAQWLAGLVRQHHELTGYPVAILGEAYKPGSDLTDGSPALLLRHYLEDVKPAHYDPYTWEKPGSGVRLPDDDYTRPLVYAIATKHPEFTSHGFRPGSVVIDPFGYIGDQPGVTVIRVGRK